MNPDEYRRQLDLQALPVRAKPFLTSIPARLYAHLIIVHHVACDILNHLHQHQLAHTIDEESVRLGAALHDIGKRIHPEEITHPGNQHELAGPPLLEEQGLPAQIARFARTHARWATEASITLEDLLVALADTCWKGQRHPPLEQTIIQQLQATSGHDPWEIWLVVDEIIEACSNQAEQFLAWQAQFPTTIILE